MKKIHKIKVINTVAIVMQGSEAKNVISPLSKMSHSLLEVEAVTSTLQEDDAVLCEEKNHKIFKLYWHYHSCKFGL